MKAGRTAVALFIIGAIAMAGIPAEDTEAVGMHKAVVWLYHESGNLWEPRTTTTGKTLTDVLNGEYGSANYWVDICTGYEWPKDRPIE